MSFLVWLNCHSWKPKQGRHPQRCKWGHHWWSEMKGTGLEQNDCDEGTIGNKNGEKMGKVWKLQQVQSIQSLIHLDDAEVQSEIQTSGAPGTSDSTSFFLRHMPGRLECTGWDGRHRVSGSSIWTKALGEIAMVDISMHKKACAGFFSRSGKLGLAIPKLMHS